MDAIGYALAQQAANTKVPIIGGYVPDTGLGAGYSPMGPIAVIGNTLYRSRSDNNALWEAVDMATGAVTPRANCPLASWQSFDPHRMAAVIAGTIYAMHFNGALQAYDPVTNTWTSKTSFGANVHYLSSDGAYLYAGGGGEVPKRYNPAANTWTTHGSATVGTNTSGQQYAADVDGKIWSSANGVVAVWNPVTMTSTTKAAHPVSSYGVKLIPTRQHVYALGGDDNSATEHRGQYRLDIAANTWQFIGQSQADGRNGHCTFPLPDGSGGVTTWAQNFGMSTPTGLLIAREVRPNLSTLLAHLASK